MKKIKILNQFGVAALALGIVFLAGVSSQRLQAQGLEDAVMSAQSSLGGIKLASFHLEPKKKPKPKSDPNTQVEVDPNGHIIVPATRAVIRHLTPEQIQKFSQIAAIAARGNRKIEIGGFFFYVSGDVGENGDFSITEIEFGKTYASNRCYKDEAPFKVEDFRGGKIRSGSYCNEGLRYPRVQRVLRKVIRFWMNQDLNDLKAKFANQ